MSEEILITRLIVKDVRFPTSKEKYGSDAMHSNPDYSCCYVILETNTINLLGYGLTFTIGKGTEVVVQAVKTLSPLVTDISFNEIINDFANFWRKLTNHSQIRWIGPEKGAIHLATSCIINAIWDIWAKIEKKPLWKLLTDMEPEKLVSTIDFRYIKDVLTEKEAIDILKSKKATSKIREKDLIENGFPAYTTSVGWIGYTNDYIRELCKKALNEGYKNFKIKVGNNLKEDQERLKIIREEIGYMNKLMLDANQKWEVNESIEWMKNLADFMPLWIEEPSNPDDVVGHQNIAKALNPLGIAVALGEQCHNRVIFKQLLQLNAMQYCQIDATRLGGLNEVLAVVLMASKFNIPVCPHAGGIGLCEYVQHISIWDYISVSGDLNNRMIEYIDSLHEHFLYPAIAKNGKYIVPEYQGYCGVLKEESIEKFEFPNGNYWKMQELS